MARSARTLRISGWSMRWPPNACRCVGVVGGPYEALPHPGGAADDAVEPGHVDHLDDRPDAAALLADPPGDGVVVLDLGRGVGPVAELVLEPLQAHAGCSEPSGSTRGSRKQVRPAGRLGEHEEQVAHRRAGEPLVAGQQVRAVGLRHRASWCWRGRPSRPASRSSTCRRAGRACRGRAQAEVVRAGGQQRLVPSRPARGRGAARARPRTSSRSGSRARRRPARRRTWRRARRARRTVRAHGRRAGRGRRRPRISSCQAGWNSTSSMRWP